jgi:hypothetical protein
LFRGSQGLHLPALQVRRSAQALANSAHHIGGSTGRIDSCGREKDPENASAPP